MHTSPGVGPATDRSSPVRINSTKLKSAAARANLTPAQIAEAIAAPGFDAKDAERAIRNWMVGRDQPRCKAATVRRLAEVLGAAPKDIAKFTSQIKYHRGSPRKARLLADLIRGKPYDQALNLLTFNIKRPAVNLKKALNAALAEAELAEADTTRLFVSESRVDEAPRIKRFQPKDRGRAHPIIKPLSHITISLEEKPEGGSR